MDLAFRTLACQETRLDLGLGLFWKRLRQITPSFHPPTRPPTASSTTLSAQFLGTKHFPFSILSNIFRSINLNVSCVSYLVQLLSDMLFDIGQPTLPPKRTTLSLLLGLHDRKLAACRISDVYCHRLSHTPLP